MRVWVEEYCPREGVTVETLEMERGWGWEIHKVLQRWWRWWGKLQWRTYSVQACDIHTTPPFKGMCIEVEEVHRAWEEALHHHSRTIYWVLAWEGGGGDNNTMYYHGKANGGKRKDTITYVAQEVGIIKGQENLLKYITIFYKNLFGYWEHTSMKINLGVMFQYGGKQKKKKDVFERVNCTAGP